MQTKIKTIKSYLRILFFLPIFMVGCGSDDSNPNPNPPVPGHVNNFTPPTATQFKAIKNSALDSKTQTTEFLVDPMGPFVNFTSEKGAVINLSAQGLAIGGVPLEIGSTVHLEFIELYSKADLLTTGIATMGKHANGDLQMLKTGGAFYLDIKQNGQSVEASYVGLNMQVTASLTGGLDDEMILWNGNFDEEGNLIWEKVENGGIEMGQQGSEIYYAFSNNLGWINIDHFWNDSRPKTSLSVDAPEGYNNTNSAVFLSFDGVLGLALVYYDTETNKYGISGDYIPIGQSGNVIFVSESEGKWVYAIKSFTITANASIEINGTDLDDATQSEIEILIEALP